MADDIVPLNRELKEFMGPRFDRLNEQHRQIVEMLEEIRRRRAAAASGEPPDDGSLALARAVERIADLATNIRGAEMDLPFAKEGVREKFWGRDRVDLAERRVADLKAAKEAAVLDLALLLAAWRRAP